MKRIKMLSLIIVAISAAFLAGCSAELKIFDGHSTGKVASESRSDGYYFIDKEDGKLKEVSGNCVIEYEKY